MRLLFSYPGTFLKDKQGHYYNNTITDDVLSRYFSIANEVSVLVRVKEIENLEETKKYSKITKDIEVVNCPKVLSLKCLLFEYKKTKQIIDKYISKVDAIVFRVPSLLSNFIAKSAKKAGKPYLVEVVGCAWDAFWNHSFKGKMFAPFMYFGTKRCVKNAPFAIYVTNEFLQKRYPCKGQTIGCSDVSLPIFENNVLENRLIKIKSMSKDKPILIGTTAAVDVSYKGQQYVIKALSKLKKEGLLNHEYQLVGAGDQSYLRKVAEKHGVPENVKLLGSLTHTEVFEWLDTIDVYIQPSTTEGLPRALIEAMSRGCPSLGSKVGGIPELLETDSVFKKSSIRQIALLIKYLNKEKLYNNALYSFGKAKEYYKEKINIRRKIFFAHILKM